MVVEKKGSGDSIGAQMIVARWVAIHSALEDKRADVRFGSLADKQPCKCGAGITDFLAHFIVGSFGGAISFLDRRRWSAGVRGHE